MTTQFMGITLSLIFFDIFLVLLSSFVTGPRFILISSLFLELWKFCFIRDWSEIRISEIPSFDFCSISGDWSRLGIPNLAQMSLLKYYWMLRKIRVKAVTGSELLRESEQGWSGCKLSPSSTQIRVYGTHIQSDL